MLKGLFSENKPKNALFPVLGQSHHINLYDSYYNVFDGMRIELMKKVKKVIDHLLNWKTILNYGLLSGLLVGLGFSVEQIWLNFISKASSFKVDLKNNDFEIESPTVTFCFNPGLKASVLKESANYHDGGYELQPIFYTNFLISGSIDNTTDIFRKSFFELNEDFYLISNVNDFGHLRSKNLTEGTNYLFDYITKLYDLEVYVKPVISALFGLCHQVELKFDMSPNTYLFFKVDFNPDLNEEDRPKVKLQIRSLH